MGIHELCRGSSDQGGRDQQSRQDSHINTGKAEQDDIVPVRFLLLHIQLHGLISQLREMPDHGKYSVPSPEKKQSALPAKILNGAEGHAAECPQVCKPHNGAVQHQQLNQPSQGQPDPFLPTVRFFPRPQRRGNQAEKQAHAHDRGPRADRKPCQ